MGIFKNRRFLLLVGVFTLCLVVTGFLANAQDINDGQLLYNFPITDEYTLTFGSEDPHDTDPNPFIVMYLMNGAGIPVASHLMYAEGRFLSNTAAPVMEVLDTAVAYWIKLERVPRQELSLLSVGDILCVVTIPDDPDYPPLLDCTGEA